MKDYEGSLTPSSGTRGEVVDDLKEIMRPDHYCIGRRYEPKDVIRDWDLNFNLGNVVKYISRAGRKDDNDILKDLKKAQQYLTFEITAIIEEREEKNHGR